MELLSWERLEAHIGTKNPALLPMGGTRGVVIGFDPLSGRLFIRLRSENEPNIPANPFEELSLQKGMVGGVTVLDISTASIHLFREFHRFAGLITEEYERGGQTAAGAFHAVVDRWRELTTIRKVLSAEEQLGLFGELAVLESLRGKYGGRAIASWTGRMPDHPERHDFRVGNVDLEVKSTRTSRRKHVIHGLRQLEPSEGHDLYLVSLKFEAGGLEGGVSLSDRVRALRQALIMQDEGAAIEFEGKLNAARYSDIDESHYHEKFILAEEPMIVLVDEGCPRLISPMVTQVMGSEQASRIGSDVVYSIDVEGLGEKISCSPQARLLGLNSME